MKKVGILMSIYNESIYEIDRAVKSMLNQTYKDYYFVIVLDNPSRIEVKNYLDDLKKKDERIILIYNEKNIGLALSLNKARDKIDVIYLCRMDADDYSFPNRIETQIKALENANVDFVFSQFYFMNSDENIIGEENDFYESKDINRLLNVINIIHHPTVMMKTDIFDKVGGYRNFPCSQDYDLWLRLAEIDCKFLMINEKLLKYTIRENSVGNSKAFKQIATLNYIKHLRNLRLKKGKDNYSEENLNKYYIKNKVSNDKKESIKVRDDLKKAQNCANNKQYFEMILLKSKIFLKYRVYRKHYMNKIIDKIRFIYFS